MTRARKARTQPAPRPLRVLFAASEALPFVKTGGLADVALALPTALAGLGVDVRVLLPAYRGLIAESDTVVAEATVYGHCFRVLERASETPGLAWWLADCPTLFDRPGTPYSDDRGWPWSDNIWRFGAFARLIAELACHPGWTPDLVHLNDWHTALAAGWLREWNAPARTLFTIHNLAYQGRAGRRDFEALGLPAHWWQPDGIEFYGELNCLKAGVVYADRLTTVSPGYAAEIQTAGFGEGLHGALRARAGLLHGICNGIDETTWNPASDPLLARRYSERTVRVGKAANKRALCESLGLDATADVPLVAYVGRLASQKGADLLLALEGWFQEHNVQLALLGAGDPALQEAFSQWAARAPSRVAVRIGYDEALAHRIEAAADLFVMPSRYEPCGLNQMYSQRYGTLPVVRRTGGLADTVVDTVPATLADGSATGVLFNDADAGGLRWGLSRGLEILADARTHRAVQRNGMTRDFSWGRAARHTLALYQQLAPGIGSFPAEAVTEV